MNMTDWRGKSHEASTLHIELQATKKCWRRRGVHPQGRVYQLVSSAKWPRTYMKEHCMDSTLTFRNIYCIYKHTHACNSNWWQKRHEFEGDQERAWGRFWREEREQRNLIIKIQSKKINQSICQRKTHSTNLEYLLYLEQCPSLPWSKKKKKKGVSQSLGLNGVNFMPFVLKSSDPEWDSPLSKPPGHSLRVTWPEEWESWLDLQDCDWAEGPFLS